MYRVVEKFGNKYAPVRLSEMRNSITSRARSRVLCKYACKVGMAYSELAGAEEEDESRIFWSLTTLNNLIILEHTLIRAYFSQKEPFPSGVWICLSISRENHDFFIRLYVFLKIIIPPLQNPIRHACNTESVQSLRNHPVFQGWKCNVGRRSTHSIAATHMCGTGYQLFVFFGELTIKYCADNELPRQATRSLYDKLNSDLT